MNATFVLIATTVGFITFAIAAWAAGLWLGLKFVRAENRRWPRIIAATALALLGFILIHTLLNLLSDRLNPSLIHAAEFVFVVGLFSSIVTSMFGIGFKRSCVVFLFTLVSSVSVVAIEAYLIKPHLLETFQAPTNSMAPSILGDHVKIKCSICGKPAFVTVDSRGNVSQSICEDFHLGQPTIADNVEIKALQKRDHFIVSKYITPKRWDIIAFRLPEQPEIKYIKRLVGLPGETITIRDGAIWVSGQRLEPPPELHGIKYYCDELEGTGFGLRLAGSENKPALLGPDEYFVLGDFTVGSADSRYWQGGAAGHPAYAVPADHIEGVVTHIFWPWSRMRSFEKH